KEQCRGGAIYRNASLDTQVEVFTEGVMNFLDPSRKFIESATHPLPVRPQDRPFCLCVTFNLPHGVGTGNMQLRPSDDELYKSAYRDRFDEMPLPKTYRAWSSIRQPRLPRHVYNGIYLPQYDYVKEPYFLRERQVRTCQTITGIDRFVGLLMEKLEELNLAGNTIIVFSTDHGLHHGEHGLGGKCFLYEEDTHIPLIIYDPRLPEHRRGQVIDRFALVPDLAPTVLELCGITPPSTMQGRSLRPLMHGEDVNWRTEFMTEQLMDIQNYPRSESLRTERWKYIRYFKRTEDPAQEGFLFRGTLDDYITCLYSTVEDEEPVYEELFDLENDPWEEHNLCLDQHPPAILDELRERLNRHIRDRLPANSPATVPLSSS
ncbi:MAG: arylsulfatase, partial [Lentisphaerae bacterium]